MIKLDKYKIKAHRFIFAGMCFGILVGIIFMCKIFEINVETKKVNAVVTNTYRGGYGLGKGSSPKMNVQWIDKSGHVRSDALYNGNHLTVGDDVQVLVDAETESKIMVDRTGAIFFVERIIFNGSEYLLKKIVDNMS